ncbi:MAG: hypothetical protein Q8K86_09060 [Candidatus Nanopelagicaceae bacterium]|nr:hypothetical protein [Candidatus Nanopelagicaceae bacterium]
MILGNGLIGLLAEKIVGGPVVGCGRSRFYSFRPPLADDYVTYDERTAEILHTIPSKRFHVVKVSLGGQLLNPDDMTYELYCNRVYGTPTHMVKLHRSFVVSICELRCNQILETLKPAQSARPTKIVPGTVFLSDGSSLSYDRLLNTVPLDILLKLIGRNMELEALDVHYAHIQTGELNFEGADEVLVIDDHIEFFKAAKIGEYDYVLWSKEALNEQIIAKYVQDFRLVQNTVIRRAIPIGLPPDLSELEKEFHIVCVGSCAQWDDAMDVASCIKRMVRYG